MGKLVIKDLFVGKYYIVEVNPAEDYVLNEEIKEVSEENDKFIINNKYKINRRFRYGNGSITS